MVTEPCRRRAIVVTKTESEIPVTVKVSKPGYPRARRLNHPCKKCGEVFPTGELLTIHSFKHRKKKK